jgi:hypothetical protein
VVVLDKETFKNDPAFSRLHLHREPLGVAEQDVPRAKEVPNIQPEELLNILSPKCVPRLILVLSSVDKYVTLELVDLLSQLVLLRRYLPTLSLTGIQNIILTQSHSRYACIHFGQQLFPSVLCLGRKPTFRIFEASFRELDNL